LMLGFNFAFSLSFLLEPICLLLLRRNLGQLNRSPDFLILFLLRSFLRPMFLPVLIIVIIVFRTTTVLSSYSVAASDVVSPEMLMGQLYIVL
jgi:hypothetical protein